MSEIRIASSELISKDDRYSFLLKEIGALLESESDLIANLANISSVLKHSFDSISWAGFYLLKEGELVLGPFQGKPACIRITIGKGVCGTAAHLCKTIIVPDVRDFPGHIFCDNETLSEIVVPLIKHDVLLGVLDLDSHNVNAFDVIDQQYLERIAALITR